MTLGLVLFLVSSLFSQELAVLADGNPIIIYKDHTWADVSVSDTLIEIPDGHFILLLENGTWISLPEIPSNVHLPRQYKVSTIQESTTVLSTASIDDITIASVSPLSGEAASFGISTKNGATLAVEEWNAAGGVFDGRKVNLISEDDKGDPAETATAFVRLIQQDHVTAIIGTVMSKCSLAGAPIAQASGIPMISPTSTNEKVTLVGDYIYRACFIDPYQGTIGANFSFKNLNARKAGVLFDINDDYTKGLASKFRTAFEALGGKVVAFDGHPSNITNFKSQLVKILTTGPDILYLPDYYNDVGLIAKQVRELGFFGPIVGADGWDSPDLVKIGGTAVENGFFTNHYSSADPRLIVRDFVNKYRVEFGEEPDALAALAYDATYIMLNAIKTAKSINGSDIRDALAKTNLDVVTGNISFDTDRNPIKSAVIIEIKGGRQIYKTTVNP